MEQVREGGCQCGALRYALEGEPVAVAACHCTECQRQSGSAFGMSLLVRETAFRWLAGEPCTFATKADSGADKDCFFCADCGVRIYNSLSSLAGLLNVKPGTLDSTDWLEPRVHTWTASKQPWVPIPEGTRTFERNPA